MAKQVGRQGSYLTVQQSRRLEIISVLCVILVGVVGTLVIIVVMHSGTPVHERCGPTYPEFAVKLVNPQEDEEGGYVTKDLIYPPGTTWEANDTVFGCPCSVKPCIRKCCPPGHAFMPYSFICEESDTTSFDPLNRQVHSKPTDFKVIEDLKPVTIDDDHFHIMYGTACKDGQFFRNQNDTLDRTYLLQDGRLMADDDVIPYHLDQAQYCLESFSGSDTVHTAECYPDQAELVVQKREGWVLLVLASGMVVSVPFFIATFLVYALLPQLQNLHGKSLMCHVMSLTISYVCLSIIQLGKDIVPTQLCVALAFVIQFTFLASFFWLNVMCFDIWWVFSGLMPLRGSIKEAEHKKFLIYSAYAWGAPLIISSLTAMMQFLTAFFAPYIRPQIGVDRCWFKGTESQVLYFYLPIGVLVFANLVMFSTTSCRLKTHTSNSKVLHSEDSRRHHENEKQRFNLYLKLFVVMGVTWVMELVSFVVGGSQVFWLLSDTCNTLQGLLIFIIFVCKPRIFQLIRQRFRPHSGYTNSRTSMSRLSRSSSCKSTQQYSVKPDVTVVSDIDEMDLHSCKL